MPPPLRLTSACLTRCSHISANSTAIHHHSIATDRKPNPRWMMHARKLQMCFIVVQRKSCLHPVALNQITSHFAERRWQNGRSREKSGYSLPEMSIMRLAKQQNSSKKNMDFCS